MDFCMWFLTVLPQFLLAEPICYFVGFAVLMVIADIFCRIITLGKR